MRLWLKDSERRPDPAPVQTDDRKAVLVGLAGWFVLLVVLLVLLGPLVAAGELWLLWTAVVGLVLGLIGLVYTRWRQR
ncbi:MAG TPA: DUF2530 domain-containing protein [Lacisediminihabitans sp.]|uniref:DUF2530 domain-containing protein n=1 Tax=Lacisediminihabitans sp. TaxID=2787631 RepID=UPI002ED90D40